jgi:hypothetical protein
MRVIVTRLLGFMGALAIVGALATPAFAGHHNNNNRRHAAPEIDPASAGAMVTLLAGGTMLLKSRRGARRD